MDKKWPDGATHFDPATGLFYRRRAEDDWEFFVNSAEGWCDSSDWHGRKNPPDRVVTRAAIAEGWTGQDGSLPPVGLTVETLWSSTTGEYVTAKVLAHDEGRAVYRITSGECKGEYGSDTQHTNFGDHLPVFRPIRTAEQLAAEEREKDAESLFQVIHPDGKWHKADGLYKERFRVAIDAGYGK